MLTTGTAFSDVVYCIVSRSLHSVILSRSQNADLLLVGTSSGTYYQLWANGVGTLNTGANGLQVFDTVVATAKA